MKKIYIVVITIVLALVFAGAGIFVYTQVIAEDNGPTKGEKVGPIMETDEFTVNVAQTTGRYIKAKFALEVSDQKVIEELEEKMPLLKDRIIMVLSSQSLQELSTVEGKEACKKAIINAINEFLEKGEVTKVYITNIIFS